MVLNLVGLVFVSLITVVVSQTPVLSPNGPTFVDENAQLVLTTTYQMSSDDKGFMQWVKNNNTQFLQLLVHECKSINPPVPTGYSIACSHKDTTYTFTLTIASINKADEGQTWRSDITTNTGTERSAETLTVRVRVPIVSVTLTNPTQNAITVLEGTQTTFICDTSESSPSSTIKWYKDQNTATTNDDQQITTEVSTSDVPLDSGTITRGTLRYTPSKQDNGWSVFCTAKNVGQLFTSRICTLTVHYQPTLTSISDKSIVAGQNLSQMCTVSDGNPTDYTYRWTPGGGFSSQSQSMLSLPSVQTSYAATYTCRVQNTMTPTGLVQRQGEDTESFTLTVLSPPTTATFRYKSQVVSETTLSFIYNTSGDRLRCESTGNPSPYYGWRRHGVSRVLSTSQDLSLYTIQRDQGGVYKCIAYNTLSPTAGTGGGGNKSSTTTITLNVLYPPNTPSLKHENSSITGNSLTVLRGDNVKVACLADSNPGPRYQWSGQSGDSQILTINNIQTDTTRSCTATTIMQTTNSGSPVSRTSSATVTINVMSPPTTPTFTYKSQAVSETTLSFIYNTPGDTLACESTGNPPPYYGWRRPDGSVMSTSHDLTLTTIQKNEGGVYTCTAYNTLSPSYGSGGGYKSSTTMISLDVLYPPITPSLRHETISGPAIPGNSLKVVQGDYVKVVCLADSNPEPHYKWSGQRGGSQILTINNIQTDTTWVCTTTNTMEATNSGSVSRSSSTTVTISVMFAPTEPTLRYNYNYRSRTMALTGSLVMVEGDSGTVSCSGSTSKPAPDAYTWYSNSGLSATGATLNINRVTKDQAGIQTCRVSNTMDRTFGNDIAGEYNKSLTVTVLYPPSISPISPQRVNEGSPLSVPCATTAGNPTQTTYAWTRSGDSSWRQDTRIMSRLKTSRTDSGNYTCKAQNTMVPTKPSGQQKGVDTKTVQVTVQYTPDVTVTTTNTTVNANSVDIVCSPSGVPKTYTYQPWTQHWSPGVEIIHTPGLGNNPTLQLTQLSYQHSGIYTCTAGNGVLASNKPDAGRGSVYLLVKSHPIITFPNTKNDSHPVSASLNADVNITIQYYTNADVTSVKLYNASIGGEEVPDFKLTTSDTNVNLIVFNKPVLTPGKLLTLTMSVTDESQFGSYKLDINNEMGNGTVFINLIPESPPDTPTLKPISESDITEHSISVSWVPGFHGGFDQTFVIQWSDDNKSWNNKSIPSDQSLSKIPVTFTIESLLPSTEYYIRIFAENVKGSSPYTQDVMTVTTLEAKTDETSTLLLAAIIGSVCGLIVIGLVIIGVICKRRQQKPKAKAFGENNRSNANHNDDDEEIDTVNPMYDSSQPMLEASNNDVYAQVNKPKKKEDNVYAMVDKSNKKKSGMDDSAQLYAIPDKTKAKKKDSKKEDKKKKGKGKQESRNKQAAGDIYENAPACAFAAKPEENLYDSAEVPQPMPAPKRNVNQDGLLYAELDLPTNPGSQKSPPVIHGLDDMTEYSEVDFTKKAEPLPDSDEEDANAKK